MCQQNSQQKVSHDILTKIVKYIRVNFKLRQRRRRFNKEWILYITWIFRKKTYSYLLVTLIAIENTATGKLENRVSDWQRLVPFSSANNQNIQSRVFPTQIIPANNPTKADYLIKYDAQKQYWSRWVQTIGSNSSPHMHTKFVESEMMYKKRKIKFGVIYRNY